MAILKGNGMPLPHEHGAWAMFLVPIALGIGATGTVRLPVLLFAFTGLAFFLLRYPVVLALKSRALQARRKAVQWGFVYAAATLSGGAALLLITRDWQWLLLAALGTLSLGLYLWYAARRAEMSLVGEWIGISGLALGAPGAHLAAAGTLDIDALTLYAVSLLYFGGTVFYVKFKVRVQPKLIRGTAGWQSRIRIGAGTLAYHIFAITMVAVMTIAGLFPWLVTAAFVPVLVKTLTGVLTPPAPRMNIRRLGFIELGVTGLFTGLVLLAYW